MKRNTKEREEKMQSILTETELFYETRFASGPRIYGDSTHYEIVK